MYEHTLYLFVTRANASETLTLFCFLHSTCSFSSSKLSVWIYNHVKYHASIQNAPKFLFCEYFRLFYFLYLMLHHVHNGSTLRERSERNDISLCQCLWVCIWLAVSSLSINPHLRIEVSPQVRFNFWMQHYSQ